MRGVCIVVVIVVKIRIGFEKIFQDFDLLTVFLQFLIKFEGRQVEVFLQQKFGHPLPHEFQSWFQRGGGIKIKGKKKKEKKTIFYYY